MELIDGSVVVDFYHDNLPHKLPTEAEKRLSIRCLLKLDNNL